MNEKVKILLTRVSCYKFWVQEKLLTLEKGNWISGVFALLYINVVLFFFLLKVRILLAVVNSVLFYILKCPNKFKFIFYLWLG